MGGRHLAAWIVLFSLAGCGGSDAQTSDWLGPPHYACDATERFEGSFFQDISPLSGITAGNFVASPAKPIPINDHSRLGFADLDGDGWDDIVMHSLFPNAQAGVPFEHLVFLNNHDQTFRDFSDESGLRDVQAGFFVFGDVDNDGDQDCFAGLDIPLPGRGNAIYLNDGAGHFTRKDDPTFAADLGHTTTGNAVFADLDGDGKLDLFLGNGQTSYDRPDQLLFGNGDGTFRDVTATQLRSDNSAQPTNGLVTCDYDGDGDLDLFVSTYGVSSSLGHKILWENDGHGAFTNVADARGFSAQAGGNTWLASTNHGLDPEPMSDITTYVGSNGFGIDCQDVDNDGLPDIYLATISHPVDSDYARKWSDPSQLLLNQGAAAGFSFRNVYAERGLPFNEGDIDAAAVDLDNDGLIDLSVTRDNKYEGNYTDREQKAWLGMFHQQPDGTFISMVVSSGVNDLSDPAPIPRMKAGQNHAYADIDHDGDLDLLVGGRDHGGGRANFLFRNELGNQNRWLAIRLVGDGVHVNRDAIGARVTITTPKTDPAFKMVREARSSRGTYDSMDTRVLHFGLGSLCDFQVEVRWPDGKTAAYHSSETGLRQYITLDYARGLIIPS